jgi:hypothetical protein
MLGAKHGQHCLVVVALEAGVSAFATVLRRFSLVFSRLDGGGCRDGRNGYHQQQQAALTASNESRRH